jgi:hypothetical protein
MKKRPRPRLQPARNLVEGQKGSGPEGSRGHLLILGGERQVTSGALRQIPVRFDSGTVQSCNTQFRRDRLC